MVSFLQFLSLLFLLAATANFALHVYVKIKITRQVKKYGHLYHTSYNHGMTFKKNGRGVHSEETPNEQFFIDVYHRRD
jgi:hypothetical protein